MSEWRFRAACRGLWDLFFDPERVEVARMVAALKQIRDAPRSRWVKQTAAWGLGDMGED